MNNQVLFILIILILATSNLSAQWVVKHVDVEGPTIYDLEMLPDGMGIAVGSAGMILRSDDYGENWIPISGNGDRNFFQIGLIAENTIVVRGDNDQWEGSIYKSVDGGNTWEDVYTHYSELFSIQFFNDSVGLASGTNTIIRSTDGGSTWSAVYDILVFTNFKVGVIWMNVASDAVAYAGVLAWNDGGENMTRYLLKSEDAGMTWEESQELGKGFGYCELYFYDEWYGFYDWDFLKRTLDGGMTWASTNNVGFVVDVSMPSMNKIYTVNHPKAYIPEPDVRTEFAICTSADGGLTWQGQMAPGAHLETIHFINDSVGFVAGDHSLIMKTEHCGGEIIGDYPWELYTTTDRIGKNSAHFRIYPNPARDQLIIDCSNMVMESGTLSIMNAITGREIFLYSFNSPFVYTLDISTWPSGMYIYQVSNKLGEEAKGKLIVE